MSLFSFGCTSPAAQPSAPNFDALAASFGALSVAVAVGSIVVALLAVGITIAWNRSTQTQAVEAARVTAQAEAVRFITSSEGRKLFEEGAATHLASNSVSQGVPPALPAGQKFRQLGSGNSKRSWFETLLNRNAT